MSNHYGFRCRACDKRSDTEINRGKDQLLEILQLLPHLKPLVEQGWSGFENGWCCWVYDLVVFAIDHEPHGDLCVEDEYGRISDFS